MSGSNGPVLSLNGEDARVDEVLDEAFGSQKPAEKPAEKASEEAKEVSEPEKPAKEFKAPQTQEELDQLIQKRIQRVEGKYKDYPDLKERASKYDALEAEKGSDVEKLTRRAEQAEKRAADAEAKISAVERRELVRDIADELGLPKKLISRVQGDDEEAIRADITELLDGLPVDKSTTAGPPVNTPKTKVKVSTGGGDSDPEWTADDIVKAIDRGSLRF